MRSIRELLKGLEKENLNIYTNTSEENQSSLHNSWQNIEMIVVNLE